MRPTFGWHAGIVNLCKALEMDTIVNVLPELDEDAVLPPRPTRVFRPTRTFVSTTPSHAGASAPTHISAPALSRADAFCKNCRDLAARTDAIQRQAQLAHDKTIDLDKHVHRLQQINDELLQKLEAQRQECPTCAKYQREQDEFHLQLLSMQDDLLRVSHKLDKVEKERDAALAAAAAFQQQLDRDFTALSSASALATATAAVLQQDVLDAITVQQLLPDVDSDMTFVAPQALDALDLALLPTSTTTTDLFAVSDTGISLLDTIQLGYEASTLFDAFAPSPLDSTTAAETVNFTPSLCNDASLFGIAPVDATDFVTALCDDTAEFGIVPCANEQPTPLAFAQTAADEDAFAAANVFFSASAPTSPKELSPFTDAGHETRAAGSSSGDEDSGSSTEPTSGGEEATNQTRFDAATAVANDDTLRTPPAIESSSLAPKTARQAASIKSAASTSAIAITAAEVLTHTEATLVKMTMHELKHFCERLGIRYVAPKATTARALLAAASKIATPTAPRSSQ